MLVHSVQSRISLQPTSYMYTLLAGFWKAQPGTHTLHVHFLTPPLNFCRPRRPQRPAHPPMPRPPVGMRAGGAAVPGYFAFRTTLAACSLPCSRAALTGQVGTAQVGAAAGGRRQRQLQCITWLRLAAQRWRQQPVSKRGSGVLQA
jgi:hypothetical protein